MSLQEKFLELILCRFLDPGKPDGDFVIVEGVTVCDFVGIIIIVDEVLDEFQGKFLGFALILCSD